MSTRIYPPLFVGAMNDGVFIIDQPPRPAPDDSGPHESANGPNVIAKMTASNHLAIGLARQMAAAPDLLEALQHMLAVFDTPDSGSLAGAEQETCAIARAALSKAEG